MRSHSTRHLVLAGMLLSFCTPVAFGQATTRPAAGESTETVTLRALAAKQAREIDVLRKEVARLTELLKRSGITADAAPATAPTPPAADAPAAAAQAQAPKSRVFVIDTSGSALAKFGDMMQELAKALSKLPETDRFTIIGTSDDKATPLELRLLPATAANKRRAFAFMDELRVSGTSNPLPGLRAAFKLRPELIWFVSDGDYPDGEVVANEVARMAGGRRTRLDTVLNFAGPGDAAARRNLFLLADAAGGRCLDEQGRIVEDADVPPPPKAQAPPPPNPPARKRAATTRFPQPGPDAQPRKTR